jgi:hypothetical protein
MSFGGGQGQIRYALMVDDQATAKLNTFKNSLTQLGAGTTAIQHPHLAMMVSKSYLAIPKEFDKLIISFRTAYSTELSLDKERTSYSDSLDALRLACKMYKMK